MSDINISGIPSMGFAGGGGGYLGGIPNQAPAMSAAQINQSMWGNYSPQQAQSTLNNIYGPMGFGGQTAQHAALGAAYGRATGGFGGAPGRVGTISNPGTSNPGYLTGGGGLPNWMGRAYPAGNVQRAPLPAPAWQNPFAQPQASAGSAGDIWSRGTPSRGVVGGWYNPYGGGGGYPQAPAPAPRPPVQSQDWQTTFNNMTRGSGGNPYALGGAPWQPSQRTAFSGGGIGT